MPQVPYTPYPTVRPTDEPIPNVRVRAEPEAFGVGIGAAVQKLGHTLETSGERIFSVAEQMQELTNRANADELTTRFAGELAPIQAKYDALQGKDAVDQLPGHIKAINELRQKYSEQATNPMVKRFFDSESRGYTLRQTFSASVRAG